MAAAVTSHTGWVVMSLALTLHTAPQIYFERVMGLQPYWVQGCTHGHTEHACAHTHTNPLFLSLPPSFFLPTLLTSISPEHFMSGQWRQSWTVVLRRMASCMWMILYQRAALAPGWPGSWMRMHSRSREDRYPANTCETHSDMQTHTHTRVMALV